MAVLELLVITKAKELCNYVLTVTDKSPKKFTYTLVSRLQNYSIEIIESLLAANEIRVTDMAGTVIKERLEQRRDYQQKAFTNIKLLVFIAQVSMEQQCIQPKQYEQINKALYNCQKFIPMQEVQFSFLAVSIRTAERIYLKAKEFNSF